MTIKNSTLRLILTSIILFSFEVKKVSAAVPADFFPQAGQTTQWTTSASNELSFNGSQPGFGLATIATTFGGLVSNDYTGLTLKFDAIISSGGENTTVVLSSNGTWGDKGILIEMNRYQILGVNNYSYPGTSLITDFPTYQNTTIKPGQYNSFIINVGATGVITVTVNGFVCPTSFNANLSVLQAVAPVPRFAYFSTGFTGFKLKNLKIEKSSISKQYFSPYAALSGTYYIDAINGSDIASGLTEAEAWRSFSNVNKTVLTAGTKILLKKGSTWNQRLEIRGSGTRTNWIEVNSYGTGTDKPKISLTNDPNDIAILICDLDKTSGSVRQQNISFIKIQNLEISNTRMGIYYRSIAGTVNTGFKVDNVTFNNINCDPILNAINSATDKNAEIGAQLAAVKGNLETLNGTNDGGGQEYIFPAGIFVGGQTFGGQTISGNNTTVLTEWEVSNCDFNEAMAGVMSWFYFPVTNTDGPNIWQQIVNKVKLTNINATGVVNGVIAFDCVNGGATIGTNNVMQPGTDGWGVFKNVNVTRGASAPGRTYPNGTTGVIINNSKNMLIDSCEFSGVLNQNNPDGCGFDFESNNDYITLQNSRFLNNDGHAILLMNGGNYGGNNYIVIQKNLFAENLKNSTSPNEFYFSLSSDGHTNIRVNNNQVFMRKKNKLNQNLTFFPVPARTYLTTPNNDLYFLDDTKPEITISFLSQAYTYKAEVSGTRQAPEVTSLVLKNGDLVTTTRTIPVFNDYSMTRETPAFYMVSENSNFAGATWNTYTPNFTYNLSPLNGAKIVYFRVKNVTGISPTFSSAITLNDVTLPVTLLSFNANKESNGSLINWETTSETNNSHFILYKSSDEFKFEQIAKITAKNQASKYQYFDASPFSGNNYYKLVQFDLDGKFKELGVKTLRFDLQTGTTFSIYPNPASEKININFNSASQNAVSLKIIDLSGRILQNVIIPSQKETANYVLDINDRITPGVYIISISSGGNNHSQKLIIQ